VAILSLKGILLYYLEQFLFSECEKTEKSFTNLSHNSNCSTSNPYETAEIAPIKWDKIPLKKHPTDSGILYTSALPKLLAATEDSQQTLADRNRNYSIDIRLSHFQTTNANNQKNDLNSELSFLMMIWAEFQIRTQRTGWLSFELSNEGIAHWLSFIQTRSMNEAKNHTFVIGKSPSDISNFHNKKSLIQRLLSNDTCDTSTPQMTQNIDRYAQSKQAPNQSQRPKVQEWLWHAQYTYARCCTLISHWSSLDGNITDGNITDGNITDGNITLSNISSLEYWLDNNRQLRASSPEDWRLVAALIEISDAMFWIPYRDPQYQYFLLLRCANQLYQAFESFYRHQLCGFTQLSPTASDKQYLQMRSRFGLVKVTLNILKTLLERHLNEIAPEQL